MDRRISDVEALTGVTLPETNGRYGESFYTEKQVDAKADAEPTLVLTTMSGVESKAVRWFWQGMISSGMLTTISADPGVGKSTLLTDMAARTSAGTPWPNHRDKPNPAGDVVLLLSEDALEYTVAPRLIAAGADLSGYMSSKVCDRLMAIFRRLNSTNIYDTLTTF